MALQLFNFFGEKQRFHCFSVNFLKKAAKTVSPKPPVRDNRRAVPDAERFRLHAGGTADRRRSTTQQRNYGRQGKTNPKRVRGKFAGFNVQKCRKIAGLRNLNYHGLKPVASIE
ncbi:hypothetical protein HZC09_00350 [Candidatus Micrarchaeota archaeon]|nr:hypothetical protein [Candidatus Micrarchaeota archaeon]